MARPEEEEESKASLIFLEPKRVSVGHLLCQALLDGVKKTKTEQLDLATWKTPVT